MVKMHNKELAAFMAVLLLSACVLKPICAREDEHGIGDTQFVEALLPADELVAIEERGDLVYLTSAVLGALQEVSKNADEQFAALPELTGLLKRVEQGYHTANTATAVTAVQQASAHALVHELTEAQNVLTDYLTAVDHGEVKFTSKRFCPPLLKKECLKVCDLCVKESCILGSQRIAGDVDVAGGVTVATDCPCCATKSQFVNSVVGARKNKTELLNARIKFNIDLDDIILGIRSGMGEGGCFTLDAPFKAVKACLLDGKIRVLGSSISKLKLIGLDRGAIFAIEVSSDLQFQSFICPPVIEIGYNPVLQRTALHSLVQVYGPDLAPAGLRFNIFPYITHIGRGYATAKVLFSVVVLGDFDLDSVSFLLQIQEMINNTVLSLTFFGTV